MKTRLLLTILLSAMCVIGYSQKIQIKSGIITKDKDAVAKLEGEATLMKGAHLKIKSLSDEPLITIDETLYTFPSYFQEVLFFYLINFPSQNQSTVKLLDNRLTSEKKIIENLFKEIGQDFLTKDGLNKDLVSTYCKSDNDSKTLQRDTTYLRSLVMQSLESLKQPIQQRDLRAPITLRDFKGELGWKGRELWRNRNMVFSNTSAIYQGNTMIGVLLKFMKKTMTTGDYTEAEYYVLRKVNPFNVETDKIEYVTLGFLKSDYNNAATIEIENDGRRNFQKISDFKSAEMHLINLLITEGKL